MRPAQFIRALTLAVVGCLLSPADPAPFETRHALSAHHDILGVWIRPDVDEDVAAKLASLRDLGFTDVFVETFYHGYTIYPSNVAPQRPSLRGRDLLAEYHAAAQGVGVRVHAWLNVLYWAPPARYDVRGGLLDLNPGWETRDAHGQLSRETAHRMGFADPGLHDVRRTVYALAAELAARAPNVGLHLDYVRYPAGGDFGYHPRARGAFRAQTASAPIPTSGAWRSWRQDVVRQVAAGMGRAYRGAGGEGLVTAAVNPHFPLYKGETRQRWPDWAGVDVFVPMAYSQHPLHLRLLSRWLRVRSPERMWMGLQVGPQYPSLKRQMAALRPEGYNNFVVFGLSGAALSPLPTPAAP